MNTPSGSSLDKALALLFAFAEPESQQRVFTVSALAGSLGMDKAQVSRVLATFAKYGIVERLEGRAGYQLGWALVPLASRSLTAQTMSELYPELSRLAVELGETVHFRVREAATSVALAAFAPDRALYVPVTTGRPEPLVGSAVGYAFLSRSAPADVEVLVESLAAGERARVGGVKAVRSAVEEAAELDYSVVVDPDGEEVTTIAAPIYDIGNYHGRVYAVIAVSAPSARFDAQRERIVSRIIEVSRLGSRYLESKGSRG
jgi:IclR family acetate operon transcriptional repressor